MYDISKLVDRNHSEQVMGFQQLQEAERVQEVESGVCCKQTRPYRM